MSLPISKKSPKEISPNWQKLKKQIQSTMAKKSKKKHRKNKKPKPSKQIEPQHNVTDSGDANDIWFDGVDPCLIKSSQITSSANLEDKKLCKENSFQGMTKCVAIDCEMVGTGFDGTNSILARVSIVNLYGHCVYDKFVKPMEEVTDYRTDVSGIRPENLINGEDFNIVQREVYNIIKNRILVGHSIHNDLKVLFLSHPNHMIRDTGRYFKIFFRNRTPSLRKLCENYLGVQIQNGEHDSVTDAQATMRLYTLFKAKWESSLRRRKTITREDTQLLEYKK